jgi:hypothetical protein
MTAHCKHCGSNTLIPPTIYTDYMLCGACHKLIPAKPIEPLMPYCASARIAELEAEIEQLKDTISDLQSDLRWMQRRYDTI